MNRPASKNLLVVVLVIAFVISPFHLVPSSSGFPKLLLSSAFAKSGSGSDGDGSDDDDEDDDDEDDEDDDEDEDDGDDDQDDDDDDEDDDDNDDDDGDDRSGAGATGNRQDKDDTRSGSGNGSGSRGSGNSGGDAGPPYKPGGAIVRVEVSRSGVKIRYADGGREEIRNGTYELRDATGRRIEQRHARGSDIARLKAVSTRVSISSVTRREASKDDVKSVNSSGGSIRVAYSNGWIEEISKGAYRLIDPYERTVATRPATAQDQERLNRLASGS